MLTATDHLVADGAFEPGRAEAAGAFQVRAVSLDDHAQGGDPGGRAKRPVHCFRAAGHTLEEVTDLLHARHVLLEKLFAVRAQVAQRGPGLIDGLAP